MLYYLLKYLGWPLLYLLFRPKVIGRENLNVKGGAIFIANHISGWDPVVIAHISPRIVHFMAKAELFQTKILGFVMRSFLAFPVERNTADISSIKNALKLLKDGKVFGIFPEGHRSRTGKMGAFENGAAMLALRSGAQVIPLFFSTNSYRRFRRVRVTIGPGIDFSQIVNKGGAKTQILKEATELIKYKITELSKKPEAAKFENNCSKK